jgi:hypothetical protein
MTTDETEGGTGTTTEIVTMTVTTIGTMIGIGIGIGIGTGGPAVIEMTIGTVTAITNAVMV